MIKIVPDKIMDSLFLCKRDHPVIQKWIASGLNREKMRQVMQILTADYVNDFVKNLPVQTWTENKLYALPVVESNDLPQVMPYNYCLFLYVLEFEKLPTPDQLVDYWMVYNGAVLVRWGGRLKITEDNIKRAAAWRIGKAASGLLRELHALVNLSVADMDYAAIPIYYHPVLDILGATDALANTDDGLIGVGIHLTGGKYIKRKSYNANQTAQRLKGWIELEIDNQFKGDLLAADQNEIRQLRRALLGVEDAREELAAKGHYQIH